MQKDQPGNPIPMEVPDSNSGFKKIKLLDRRKPKDVRGNYIVCYKCKKAGGTMVKDHRGYKHKWC